MPTGQSTKFTIWKYWEDCAKKLDGNDPNFSANNSRILHHDKTPAHTALSVSEFLATKQITVLEQPAYSPDLAPSDFFLFPKIKEILKGRHFDDIDDIRSNTMAALKAIPQNQSQNCFEGWTRCWHRCIASQGEYFEGDHGGFSDEVCSTYTAMSSRTLLSDHVCNGYGVTFECCLLNTYHFIVLCKFCSFVY